MRVDCDRGCWGVDWVAVKLKGWVLKSHQCSWAPFDIFTFLNACRCYTLPRNIHHALYVNKCIHLWLSRPINTQYSAPLDHQEAVKACNITGLLATLDPATKSHHLAAWSRMSYKGKEVSKYTPLIHICAVLHKQQMYVSEKQHCTCLSCQMNWQSGDGLWVTLSVKLILKLKPRGFKSNKQHNQVQGQVPADAFFWISQSLFCCCCCFAVAWSSSSTYGVRCLCPVRILPKANRRRIGYTTLLPFHVISVFSGLHSSEDVPLDMCGLINT